MAQTLARFSSKPNTIHHQHAAGHSPPSEHPLRVDASFVTTASSLSSSGSSPTPAPLPCRRAATFFPTKLNCTTSSPCKLQSLPPRSTDSHAGAQTSETRPPASSRRLLQVAASSRQVAPASSISSSSSSPSSDFPLQPAAVAQDPAAALLFQLGPTAAPPFPTGPRYPHAGAATKPSSPLAVHLVVAPRDSNAGRPNSILKLRTLPPRLEAAPIADLHQPTTPSLTRLTVAASDPRL